MLKCILITKVICYQIDKLANKVRVRAAEGYITLILFKVYRNKFTSF